MNERTVLEVEELSFTYTEGKTAALRRLSFAVREGEFFCVIGPNGSGKSTLCNALVGLIPFYFSGKLEGEVRVMGIDTKDSSVADLCSQIGLVFQNPFNQLSYTAGSVAEELAYGLGNSGVPRAEMQQRVTAVAKLMRIDHIIHKNPLELSGSQVQRVALGSTFIMEPRILVLDECTTQLDPVGSEEIFDIIKRLNADGITVVMVDHDMERVARCADRILVIDAGKQVMLDTPRRVFSGTEISAHRVAGPDYTRIYRALEERGWYAGPPCVAETAVIEAVKRACAP